MSGGKVDARGRRQRVGVSQGGGEKKIITNEI